MHPEVKGKNIAIITHAGGPAVMLTDVLSNNGLEVPPIEGKAADTLLSKLFRVLPLPTRLIFLATALPNS